MGLKNIQEFDKLFGKDKFLFYDFLVGLRIEDERGKYDILDVTFNPKISTRRIPRGDQPPQERNEQPLYKWWEQLREDQRSDLTRLFNNIQRGGITGLPKGLPIYTRQKRRTRKKMKKKSTTRQSRKKNRKTRTRK